VTFAPRDQPLELTAWWMPASGAAKAAVVMAHGGGSNRSELHTDWLALAAALTKNGYGVLAVDLRNHGDSGDTAIGPTFGPDESNDVIAAMDYLQRRQAATRFAALGHSMGGQTSLYAAARDARVEAVVSDGTYTDVALITPSFAEAATGVPAALFGGPFLWSAERLHGLRLGEARAIDVIGTIAPRPVLLIHDQDDPIVPVAQARALALAYPGAELWVTETPDAELARRDLGGFGTHVQSYRLQPDAYAQRVVEFLDRTFAN
jgi:pimeloyl-ACP methyl ester carboxylesterase